MKRYIYHYYASSQNNNFLTKLDGIVYTEKEVLDQDDYHNLKKIIIHDLDIKLDNITIESLSLLKIQK